eukprot:scaffold170972_cov22-Tisochrysis_lutea.AAC.2
MSAGGSSHGSRWLNFQLCHLRHTHTGKDINAEAAALLQRAACLPSHIPHRQKQKSLTNRHGRVHTAGNRKGREQTADHMKRRESRLQAIQREGSTLQATTETKRKQTTDNGGTQAKDHRHHTDKGGGAHQHHRQQRHSTNQQQATEHEHVDDGAAAQQNKRQQRHSAADGASAKTARIRKTNNLDETRSIQSSSFNKM